MDADLRGYRNYGRAAACIRSSDVDGCRETHHLRIRRTSTSSSDKVSYVEKKMASLAFCLFMNSDVVSLITHAVLTNTV